MEEEKAVNQWRLIKKDADGNLVLNGSNYKGIFKGSMKSYTGETRGDHYASGHSFTEYWFAGSGVLKDKTKELKHFFVFSTDTCERSSRLEEMMMALPEEVQIKDVINLNRLADIVINNILVDLVSSKISKKEIPEVHIDSIKKEDLVWWGMIPDKGGQLYLGLS